ncbi:CLUMA_CG020110, isoform A [Clunio marinus]|uniref:CLUMA_CG020110, isoform A n=1 Tax=Clunio marinus TaxID=568069 RepID=A0A1J1J879_9DIPT|nr:CLUMA_CG020110, isoform A [Clunio marinus]
MIFDSRLQKVLSRYYNQQTLKQLVNLSNCYFQCSIQSPQSSYQLQLEVDVYQL